MTMMITTMELHLFLLLCHTYSHSPLLLSYHFLQYVENRGCSKRSCWIDCCLIAKTWIWKYKSIRSFKVAALTNYTSYPLRNTNSSELYTRWHNKCFLLFGWNRNDCVFKRAVDWNGNETKREWKGFSSLLCSVNKIIENIEFWKVTFVVGYTFENHLQKAQV